METSLKSSAMSQQPRKQEGKRRGAAMVKEAVRMLRIFDTMDK